MSIITQCSMTQSNELDFARGVVDILQTYFPGWEWSASLHEGVVYFKNLTLSPNWGMQKSVLSVDKAWIIQAGGELLERFNMPYTYREHMEIIAKKDFTGQVESEKWTKDRRYFNKTEKRWKA